MDRTATAEPGDGRSARPGLLVLALAAFTAVTTEMLPVGLLAPISQAFDRPESATGLLVSLFAAMVTLLAVPMTLATRRVPGKRLLLATMASYGAGNVLCALAPSFGLFALARGLGGLTHAVFFSVCIGYASRLVPAGGMGRALALVSAGPSAALILGSPLATALGDAAGWRAAFAALAGLTVLTFAALALVLPALGPAPPSPQTGRARHGRRQDAVTVIAANALTYLGQFTLYTYVSVVLLRSGASQGAVAPLLFLFGVFGLAGIWRAAPVLDRSPRRAAVVILGVVALGVLALGAGIPSLLLVTLAGVVWNAAFGPVNSLFQSATIRTGAIAPELAGAWINTTSNFGIAAGALLGGVVLDGLGVHALAWVGAVPILLALVLSVVGGAVFAADRDAGSAPSGDPVPMTRFTRSACIEWLFAEDGAPVAERIRRAADAGLDAVEFWHWRDKDLGAVGDAARAGGLRIVMMLVEPQVPIVDAARLEEFTRACEESAQAAADLGCRTLVVASGERLPGVSEAEQDAAIVAALRAGGEIAGRHDLTLLFEPLNDTDHPGVFVTGTAHGLRLVEAAGSPHVKLLYDVYHSAVMGEEPGEPVAGAGDAVGHVHVADHPGRGEPGTGGIDWPSVLHRLDDAGYNGDMGLEYRPTTDTTSSLAYLSRAME